MKIAICSSFYEAGRPFLADFLGAFQRAREATAHRVELIAADHGLVEIEKALGAVAPSAVPKVPPGASVAEVREAMLRAGMSSDADALVFVDMDDRIAVDAVERHRGALARADISFGDLALIDESGRALGRCLLDGLDIPSEFGGIETLASRNFLGLSNTAVRRSILTDRACGIPKGLVACDWWLFSVLLMEGASAKRAEGVVGEYRIHSGNTLGYQPDPSVESIRKRCRIVRDHYAALPAHAALRAADARVADLMTRLEADPTGLAAERRDACRPPLAWFEEIARLSEKA